MLLFENISLALSGLRANKTRSVLTMLGIIIGIASVIAIMTIGASMTESMQSSMTSMGATNITIAVSQKSTEEEISEGGMRFEWGPHSTEMDDDDLMDEEMLSDLKEHFSDNIEGFVLSEELGSGEVRSGQDYAYVSVDGGNDGYIEGEKLNLISGRLFTEKDQSKGKKVCIISDYTCNNLFRGDTEAALGKELSVVLNDEFHHFTVVGVYEYNSTYNFSTASVEDTETSLYIPLYTAFKEEHKDKLFSRVEAKTSLDTDVTSFLMEVQDYMNEHFYRNNKSFEVNCFSLSDMLSDMQNMMSTLSLAISFIAGISLLVGGIGVMNIMLVSIQERTKEIGTRKALGATNASIRTQFIVEAIVLCMVGGAIGIALGLGIGMIAAQKMGYEAYPSVNGILFSVGFSVAIGVFFGYYPANKAAKMNPVDALRYE
ncbi:MAG: ABC transporter permease [Lachnospiraceae bacterium]|nr:ABC transporter permease [Lachnospiraceae bacterium]